MFHSLHQEGLKQFKKITADPGSKLREYVDAINHCYPEEAIRYFNPQYPASIAQEIEQSTEELTTNPEEGTEQASTEV